MYVDNIHRNADNLSVSHFQKVVFHKNTMSSNGFVRHILLSKYIIIILTKEGNEYKFIF